MAEINSEFVSIIYKTRKVLIEQLKKRGFNVNDYDNFTVGEISLLIENSQLDMLLENDNGSKLYVKYDLRNSSKNSRGSIYETIEMLYKIEELLNEEKDELLYILLNEPNDKYYKNLDHIWNNEKIYVNAVSLKRLTFNILNHNLVPEHKVMSELEVKEFKDKYNVDNEVKELPEISRYDPVAVAIGLRPGQITEITRSSKTSMTSKYYRVCV